jgi:hypothetical protein
MGIDLEFVTCDILSRSKELKIWQIKKIRFAGRMAFDAQ